MKLRAVSVASLSPPNGDYQLLLIPYQKANPDWEAAGFRNAAFRFTIFPGCRTRPAESGTGWVQDVEPEVRDTELSFVVTGGNLPLTVGPGGVPAGMALAGSTMYFATAVSGIVYALDTEAMSLSRSFY